MQHPAQEASPKQAGKPGYTAGKKISMELGSAADKLLLITDLASLEVAQVLL